MPNVKLEQKKQTKNGLTPKRRRALGPINLFFYSFLFESFIEKIQKILWSLTVSVCLWHNARPFYFFVTALSSKMLSVTDRRL